MEAETIFVINYLDKGKQLTENFTATTKYHAKQKLFALDGKEVKILSIKQWKGKKWITVDI